MIHVHKWSDAPVDPWSALRCISQNNIAPEAKGQHLILWHVESVRHGGRWHYIMDFEPRDTPEVSAFARELGHPMERYPQGPDWEQWLGDQWQFIDEYTRWMLLNPTEQATDRRAQRDVRISLLKLGTSEPKVAASL